MLTHTHKHHKVCIHACTCVYVYTRISLAHKDHEGWHTWHICAHTRSCSICIPLYVNTYINTYIHTYIENDVVRIQQTFMYTYIQNNVVRTHQTYIYTYIYIHTYIQSVSAKRTCIHTYIQNDVVRIHQTCEHVEKYIDLDAMIS